MTIRPERVGDEAAIHAVHVAAFPTDAEARLVDALRDAGRLSISLVADANGRIAGHIAFSPVTVDGAEGGLGLAPVAVLPERQRQGVGGRLIEKGIQRARESGARVLVVLGHPEFYPRFGFQKASMFRLTNEYGADEAFMALRLGDDPTPSGLVKYCEEFAMFG
jgi:putative acetyltransferase